MLKIDKKRFWENKITTWEKDRYGDSPNQENLSNAYKKVSSSSLQFRLIKAAELLAPYLKGKRILDIGCGSGLFYEKLKSSEISRYIGIDLASNAIESAQIHYNSPEDRKKAVFLSGNLLETKFAEFDIAVAFGVLDWLTLEEIDRLFEKIKPKPFLFTISEKKISISRWIHVIYVHLAYGWKTKGYVPRYYPMNQILQIAKTNGYENIQVLRHKKLRFGAFLYKLD